MWFGSQRVHHQGALYSAWLKITRMILSCPLTWARLVLWQPEYADITPTLSMSTDTIESFL